MWISLERSQQQPLSAVSPEKMTWYKKKNTCFHAGKQVFFFFLFPQMRCFCTEEAQLLTVLQNVPACTGGTNVFNTKQKQRCLATASRLEQFGRYAEAELTEKSCVRLCSAPTFFYAQYMPNMVFLTQTALPSVDKKREYMPLLRTRTPRYIRPCFVIRTGSPAPGVSLPVPVCTGGTD